MEPSYHGFKRILKIQVPIRGGTGPPILHNYEVSRVKVGQNKTLLNRSWSRQHLSSLFLAHIHTSYSYEEEGVKVARPRNIKEMKEITWGQENKALEETEEEYEKRRKSNEKSEADIEEKQETGVYLRRAFISSFSAAST